MTNFSLLLVEFDDIYGPIPKLCFPQAVPIQEQKQISLAAFDFIFHLDKITNKISIVSFPTSEKKGLIRAMEWKNESKRGEVNQSALVLLFEDKDDSVFYKYGQDITIPINEICDRYLIRVKSPADTFTIEELKKVHQRTSDVIKNLEVMERKSDNNEEFPSFNKKNRAKYLFKIIIVGDPNVGKSSTILRFVDHAFKQSYIETIGVNISVKVVNIDNESVELSLWDLAGQTKYSLFREQFYRNANAIVFVFDRTNPETFNNLRKWFSDIQSQHRNFKTVAHRICGNKSDLYDKIVITNDQAKDLATELNSEYIDISAKDNLNIENIFVDLSKQMIDFIEK